MCVTDALTGQKKGPQIPVNWSYRWLRVRELNLGSLQKQQALWSTEQSVQLLTCTTVSRSPPQPQFVQIYSAWGLLLFYWL